MMAILCKMHLPLGVITIPHVENAYAMIQMNVSGFWLALEWMFLADKSELVDSYKTIRYNISCIRVSYGRSTNISETAESMMRRTYLNSALVYHDFPSPSVLNGTSNNTFLMKMKCLLLDSVDNQIGREEGTEVAITFESLSKYK